MSKRLRLITAGLLMVSMVFTSTFAFAGESQAADSEDVNQDAIQVELNGQDVDEQAVQAEEQAIVQEQAEADLEAAAEEDSDFQVMATDSAGRIKAVALNYSNSEPSESDAEYIYCKSAGSYTYWEITAGTSGMLWFDAAPLNKKTQDNYNVGYTTAQLGTYNASTGKWELSGSLAGLSAGGDDYDTGGGIDVKSGGKYCIAVYSSYANDGLAILPYVIPYETRTLAAGKTMIASGYTRVSGSLKDKASLFKIKPSKSGYITVSLKEYGCDTSAGYVTLLNSSKKAVSDKLWYYEGSKTSYIRFGVKKGTTYYLKVNGAVGSFSEQYAYGIQYKVTSAAVKKNTTKKKATNLKRKAKYTAVAMPATGKKATQWYKFKVTKQRATQIKVDATNVKSGKTTITVYCGKKKIDTKTISNGYVNTYTVYNSTKPGKAKKGTYYVKISKNAKANGAIKIKYAK